MPGNDYYQHKRDEMLVFIPKGARKILDVGCGSGAFCRQIQQAYSDQAFDFWGIEISEIAAEQGRDIIPNMLVGDALEMIEQLPDQHFDCIIFNDSLEHFVDPYKILEAVKAKLSKEGVIVSSIPNVRHYEQLYDYLFKKKWHYVDAGLMDRTHLRFFTRSSIIDMFESGDYRILQLEGIHVRRKRAIQILNFLLFGLLDDVRMRQFAVVAKPN